MKHFATIVTRVTFAVLLLTACHAPQPIAYHSDTIRVDRWHYDSIDRWHTRNIYIQGDTVHQADTFYTDRWHIRWRDSIRTVHDSIPYPVEVVKTEIDYKGWWWFGGLAAVCLLLVVVRVLRFFK